MGIQELFFQVFHVRIVDTKLPFERSIGDPLLTLEKCEDLSNHLIEIHDGSPRKQYTALPAPVS
jgi:hypothetical protein